MKKETLFGIPIEEVDRQLAASPGYAVDPQSKMQPINPEYGECVGILDPVIEGGEKILEDPELRERVKKNLKRIKCKN